MGLLLFLMLFILIGFITFVLITILNIIEIYICERETMTNQFPISFSIGGDIIDTNTDLRIISIKDATNVILREVYISSMTPAGTGGATIEIRNTASGAGSGITVTIAAGAYEGSNTGAVTLIDNLYIRSGTPNGLSDINGKAFVTWS